jgi:hypothetical protein
LIGRYHDVVRDATKTIARDERHRVVPRIRVQRPTVTEHNRLTGTPVREEHVDVVLR